MLPARRSFLLSFAVACTVAFVLDAISEHAIESGDLRGGAVAPTVLELTGVYQRVVASGPRQPVPRFTAIVTLRPVENPATTNVCAQRSNLASLLRAIGEQRPSVIVIDKYFSDPCSGDPEGTEALGLAIREVSREIPIVIGRRIDTRNLRSRSLDASPPALVPAIDFGAGGHVHEGVVNIDRDTRRLPLGWTVQPDESQSPVFMRSISLEAAFSHDPRIGEKYPLLGALVARRQNPFVSFLGQSQYEKYALVSADSLVCTSSSASACPAPTLLSNRTLANRVVVVGEVNEDVDEHWSVLGKVPGVLLQANYIEALLDQRYFWPAPWWLNYAIGFLIFLALQWVLHVHHSALHDAHGWRVAFVVSRALAWFAVVIFAALVAIYLVVMHVGWYVNPLTIGAAALMSKIVELLFSAMNREGGDAHA